MDEEWWERLRVALNHAGWSTEEVEPLLDDLAWTLMRRRRERDALQRDLEAALTQILEDELPQDPKEQVAAIAAFIVARLERRWWFWRR